MAKKEHRDTPFPELDGIVIRSWHERMGGYIFMSIIDPETGEPRREYLHRLIMEQLLGRRLQKGEAVIHTDGDIENNTAHNLKLVRWGGHRHPNSWVFVECAWCGEEFEKRRAHTEAKKTDLDFCSHEHYMQFIRRYGRLNQVTMSSNDERYEKLKDRIPIIIKEDKADDEPEQSA